MNDVRKMIYGSIIGFFLVLSVWFSIIYVSSCGFSFTCNQAAPLVHMGTGSPFVLMKRLSAEKGHWRSKII